MKFIKVDTKSGKTVVVDRETVLSELSEYGHKQGYVMDYSGILKFLIEKKIYYVPAEKFHYKLA